jgi:phage terminase small subunit
MSEGQEPRKLTNRQRIFIDEYLRSFNATRAALAAGYSEKTARSIGSENLTKPDVVAEIDERLKESHLSADEALARLADFAKGDIGDLLDDNGLLDIRLAKEKGMTKLLRKIKQKTITRIGKKDDDDDVEITEIEFEMHDAQAAIDKILRVSGKYKDTVSLQNPDGSNLAPAVVNVYLPDNNRDKKE